MKRFVFMRALSLLMCAGIAFGAENYTVENSFTYDDGSGIAAEYASASDAESACRDELNNAIISCEDNGDSPSIEVACTFSNTGSGSVFYAYRVRCYAGASPVPEYTPEPPLEPIDEEGPIVTDPAEDPAEEPQPDCDGWRLQRDDLIMQMEDEYRMGTLDNEDAMIYTEMIAQLDNLLSEHCGDFSGIF